jgi:hypothetical protein
MLGGLNATVDNFVAAGNPRIQQGSTSLNGQPHISLKMQAIENKETLLLAETRLLTCGPPVNTLRHLHRVFNSLQKQIIEA